MALTQIKTTGIADNAVTDAKVVDARSHGILQAVKWVGAPLAQRGELKSMCGHDLAPARLV